MESTRIQTLKKVITDLKILDKKKSIPFSEHSDLREIRIHRASESALRNLEIARTNARTLSVRS